MCASGDKQVEAAIKAGAVVISRTGYEIENGIYRLQYGECFENSMDKKSCIVNDVNQTAMVRKAGKDAIPWVTMNIFNTPSTFGFARYFFQ